MQVSDHLWQTFKSCTGICTDSRQLLPGQLFFALHGDNFDGHAFVSGALEKGAIAAVISNPALAGDPRYILVPDTLKALQGLARRHRLTFDIPVIAITGSNGKTTTKELMASVLKTFYKVHYTHGNLNNHLGVPLTLLSMPADTQVAIIEMGANHQGEIRELCEIAWPTYGLITNIGKAHLEGFGGYEGVKKAKGELYVFLANNKGTIIFNADDEVLSQLIPSGCKTISYGQSANRHPDFHFHLTTASPTININCHAPQSSFPSQLYGLYNVPNILAAIVAGLHLNVPIPNIKQGIFSYLPANQRSQWLTWHGHQVMMDAYNANPSSMSLAIQTFEMHPAERKILILGDMRELGEWSLVEHQQIVNILTDKPWYEVILIGEWFGKTKHPFRHFATTGEAKDYITKQFWPPSTILLKGSRGMTLEKIIQ